MRNRKRHTVQPMLEAMESRVALSTTTIHLHHERAVAAHVDKVTSNKTPTEMQRENIKAMRNLQQQLNVVHEHALERTPSAIPTAAEQRATQISNVFKSLETAL